MRRAGRAVSAPLADGCGGEAFTWGAELTLKVTARRSSAFACANVSVC